MDRDEVFFAGVIGITAFGVVGLVTGKVDLAFLSGFVTALGGFLALCYRDGGGDIDG